MFSALLMSPSFATFLLTSVVLAITPGPAVLYLLARTLQSGRGAGLASIAGVAVGNLGNATIASLGLAVVIAQSAAAFTLVKWIGAAYLMFLGIQALRAKPPVTSESAPDESAPIPGDRPNDLTGVRSGQITAIQPEQVTAIRAGRARIVRLRQGATVASGRLFRDGFWVALLNPKTALFFAALLPQFVTPGAAPLQQTWMLGCIFVAVALCTDTVYVLAAAAIAPRLRTRSPRRPYGRYLSAATFFGLGLYAAVASPRSTPPPLH